MKFFESTEGTYGGGLCQESSPTWGKNFVFERPQSQFSGQFSRLCRKGRIRKFRLPLDCNTPFLTALLLYHCNFKLFIKCSKHQRCLIGGGIRGLHCVCPREKLNLNGLTQFFRNSLHNFVVLLFAPLHKSILIKQLLLFIMTFDSNC